MKSRRCRVVMGQEDPFGHYANSFRIVQDSESEVFLDFCVYSASTDTAQVVSRLRVHMNFLQVLQDRLNRDLAPKPEAGSSGLIFLVNPYPNGGEEEEN